VDLDIATIFLRRDTEHRKYGRSAVEKAPAQSKHRPKELSEDSKPPPCACAELVNNFKLKSIGGNNIHI